VTIEGIKAYRKAAGILGRKRKTDPMLSTLSPVMLGFALEKSLKGVLRFVEHKEVRGHDLLKLFESLNEGTQVWLMLQTGAKPRHFWRMLATDASAFVQWRYLEEVGEEETLYFSDDDIAFDLIRACVKLLHRELLRKATEAKGERVTTLREAYGVLNLRRQ
jgi:HEPN domain-containing protein